MALQIAENIIREMPGTPLQLIAPSGHELGFYGAYYMAKTIKSPPKAVLHLGSCIASFDRQLQGIVHTKTSARRKIAEALKVLNVVPEFPENHTKPESWVGEAQCWAEFGMPMVSIAGVSPLFHTPHDIAETATSPKLLAHTAAITTDIAKALLQDLTTAA